MHIMMLAAAAVIAGAPSAVPAVEHRVTVFQQDFPMSHRDGQHEYRRFMARNLFDGDGRPRTVGLVGCGRTCEYLELRMAEKTGASWSQGSMIPVMSRRSDARGAVEYAFSGQKGRISYADGQGALSIEDHGAATAREEGRANAYHAMRMELADHGDSYAYYPTYSADGIPVMRLVVAWDKPRPARID